MKDKQPKQPMGTPRQVRFPAEIERGLQDIADANGLEWVDVVRLATRTGLPILKKRMGSAVKQTSVAA